MMIGFGAKDLVGDIVAGFFTIVEGTYKVGDFVTIGGWSGTVVEIGLRTTKVQAFADTKVFNNSAMQGRLAPLPRSSVSGFTITD